MPYLLNRTVAYISRPQIFYKFKFYCYFINNKKEILNNFSYKKEISLYRKNKKIRQNEQLVSY